MGGYSRFAKEAGKLLFETAVNWRTPGFEANDLAFNTRADYFWTNSNLALSLSRPTRWYRSYFLTLGTQREYNFDGDRTDTQIHAGAFGQLLNYWQLNFFAIRRLDVMDDRLTRGGPVVKRPGNMFYSLNVGTDGRKRISLFVNPTHSRSDEGYTSTGAFTQISVRAAPNASLSIAPSFNRSSSGRQWVNTFQDETATHFYGTRVVFADLRQKTLALDTRVNLTFSPTLTFELFAQPFISSVHYSRFKEVAAPRSEQLVVYGEDAGTIVTERSTGAEVTGYRIDPDGAGPAQEIALNNPDFNVRSLRGNAVLRWEYRPGSTLFLVWARTSSDFAPRVGDFSLGRDGDALFSAKADNIFLVKLNFWLNR